jgi:hypothetical protein
MVCDPETVHFKEEVNGNMNSTNSSPSIVQLYSHTQSGGKQWNIEALYESCRLRVLMASSGQMSKMRYEYFNFNMSNLLGHDSYS